MKIKKIFKTVIGIVLICAIVTSLSACGKTSISLKEHVTVTFSTYEGFGEAKISVDENAINNLVDKESVKAYIKSLSSNQAITELSEMVNFSDLLSFNLKENYKNLSNGDEVQVEVTINEMMALAGATLENLQEELKINIKDTVMTFTVEGLETAKVIDPLSFVDDYVVYEGANGGGEAKVEFPNDFSYEQDGFSFVRHAMYSNMLDVIYDHKELGSITYHCKYEDKLNKGQSFEVGIQEDSWDPLNLDDIGYVFNTTKTMITPDLGEYITSKDEITDELKNAIDVALKEELSDEEYKIHEYHWGNIKSTTTTNNKVEDEHRIFVMISYDEGIKGYFSHITFVNYGTEKMIKLPDGSYYVKLCSCGASDTLEKVMADDYDCEKLDF